MPVTAKFSKQFYDKLGHPIVDELVNWFNQVDATYRSDLRELNELNFARFDSRVGQRLAEYDAKWEQRWAQLDAKIEGGLAHLEGRLIARIGQTEARLTRLTVTLTVSLWAATVGTMIALHAF